jgi:dynein heavy chain
VFWLGGFTFPTGFLTAILQKSARANSISVDAITWDFVVLKETNPAEITTPPKEGVYVSGMYLEGAGYVNASFSCIS